MMPFPDTDSQFEGVETFGPIIRTMLSLVFPLSLSFIFSFYCHSILFQPFVDMKTMVFSRCAGILVSLLSCVFFILYFGHHDLRISMHRYPTVFPSLAPSDHDSGVDRHTLMNGPSTRRPPSVDYIDLASKDLFPRRPYNIYPNFNGHSWSQRWYGSQQPCLGPRGVHVNSNPDDMLEAWPVGPNGETLVSSCSTFET